VGIPTLGFVEAVRALDACGDLPVRLAAVNGIPFHFQLFLDDALNGIVACLGVDQRLGYRLRAGDQVSWTGEVVARASDEFPGWVRPRMRDAAGRWWSFLDKTPIFDLADGSEMATATTAAIRCRP